MLRLHGVSLLLHGVPWRLLLLLLLQGVSLLLLVLVLLRRRLPAPARRPVTPTIRLPA